MSSRLPIIKAKLDSFRASIGGGDHNTRVSIIKVQEFNKILADVRSAFPAQSGDLPVDFSTFSDMRMLGKTDVFLPDLEYAIRLTLAIVELLEPNTD